MKAGAQDFARSVLQSLENRMPEDPIMTALQIFDVSAMPSCDEEWKNVGHEYGNTQIETLIQHYGHNKRSQRFKLKAGAQDFARSVLQSLENRMPEDPIMTALQIFDVSAMPSCDEEWKNVGHEYGNTQIETLIQHYGHNKRSQRFKLIPGQEFLSKIDPVTVRAEWGLFKEVLFSEKKQNLSNEETYKSLLQDSSVLLEDAALPCIKYLS